MATKVEPPEFEEEQPRDDAINGPYDGEIESCPNCGGSGDAKDMTFW